MTMSLQYTRDFQIRLLITLLSDHKFFEDVSANMHLTDFDLPACRLIFEVARVYFNQYKKLPPFSVLQLEVLNAAGGNDPRYETFLQAAEMESLAEVMAMVANRNPADIAVDYFRVELRKYLSFVRIAKARESAAPAEQHIAEVIRVNEELSRMNTDSILFENALDSIPDIDTTGAMRIGTGIPKVDSMINGGLKRSQIGMLVACTGVGKTCGMINFAVNTAVRGYLSLIITLENPGAMIRSRYQSIMAHLNASLFMKTKTSWDQDELWRLDYSNSPQFKFRNNVIVADCSQRQHTIAEIDRAILKWKSLMVERYGYSEDLCYTVFVDWLERISFEGISSIGRNTAEDAKWQKVLEALGELARKHNVILWTATQGTRDAEGREVLHRKHTAHSVHIHDGLDLSIGLAPMIVADPTIFANQVVPDEDTNFEQPPCDRMLNATFMKTRESSVEGRYVRFYQGHTLRFWPNKEQADLASKIAKHCSMDQLYQTIEHSLQSGKLGKF